MTPRLVNRLRGEGIVEVAAGYNHVVAVSDAGDVWSWGTGLQAALGHGDLENQVEPKLVATLQEKVIIAVSVGHSHSVAISDEDIPYTWGSLQGCVSCELCTLPLTRRISSQLGRCMTYTRSWSCRGRLGLGIAERSDPNPRLRKFFLSPTLIPFFRTTKVLQVACSANHCLALVRDENQVYSWGGGDGGRLGHGDTVDRFTHAQ